MLSPNPCGGCALSSMGTLTLTHSKSIKTMGRVSMGQAKYGSPLNAPTSRATSSRCSTKRLLEGKALYRMPQRGPAPDLNPLLTRGYTRKQKRVCACMVVVVWYNRGMNANAYTFCIACGLPCLSSHMIDCFGWLLCPDCDPDTDTA